VLRLRSQALALQWNFRWAAPAQPAKLRLLLLMAPGDLAANTPLDCLLEKSDVDLDFYYLTPGQPFAAPVPEHDALLVALSESDGNLELLQFLEGALADWPKPVLNLPAHIPNVGRARASALLQNVPGLLMPLTLRAERRILHAIAATTQTLGVAYAGCDFPVIVRPVDSHSGHNLAKIASPQDLADYLKTLRHEVLLISPFVDYSGPDGYFRKIRVALIEGIPYACHMAVSLNWMIHYVSASLYDEFWKREQELAFMTHFQEFTHRHCAALTTIADRIGLDYVCLDCAQTQSGELLVFDVDHAMVVHAMDPQAQFPYKQIYMSKVKDAFCDLLYARAVGVHVDTL